MGIESTTTRPKAYENMTRSEARSQVREALQSFLLGLSPFMNTTDTEGFSVDSTLDTTCVVSR